MARIGQLIYAPEVQDKASGPLNAIGAAADRAGAAFEGLDTRVRRNEASFEQVAARLDVVERAAQKVERATSSFTRSMEQAERQALAQGIAQERLAQVLASGAQAREAAALAAVRGLTAEQQAAALTRAGYASLATQVQATAAAQSNLGVQTKAMASANDNATASTGRMSGVLGQASFQVQDFVSQVQMGQNALMAFGVQGAQLLGAMGTGGAIAGALLVFGTLAVQMAGLGSATDTLREATDAVKSGYDRLNEAAERRQRGMRDEAEAVALLADEYRGMGLAASRAESLLVERRGAALDLEGGRMREALQGTLSSGVLQRIQPRDATNILGEDLGLARVEQQLAPLADILSRIGSQAGLTQQNIRELAAEADRLAQAGGTGAQSFVRMRDAALDLLPAAAQLDAAQRQLAVQTVAAAEAMGNSEEVVARYAARFGALATEIMSAGRSLNALRQGGIGIAESAIANEIRRNEAVLAAIRAGGVGAGMAARDAGTREEQILRRATELATVARREMEAANMPLEQIRETLRESQTEFVVLATRAVDSGRAVDEGLKPARDGARGAAAAIRDAADAYSELRRDASTGLLLVSDADARTLREVSAQLRGTSLDPTARRRAEAEVERQATRQSEILERQNQQTTDSIVRYGADAFADMFRENSRGWAGMLDTFRNTFRSLMARLAAEAIIRPIIAPIVQGLGLGQLGSGGGGLGSLLSLGGGTMGGAGGVADPGSTQGAINSAGQAFALRQAGGFGGLGNAFTSANSGAYTGLGFVDSALNAQLLLPGNIAPATDAALAGLGGAFGPATPSQLAAAGATPGLSVAGAIGGTAGILGGAYGIYSGIQRGGVGGAVGALGGAAGVAGGGLTLASGLGLIGPGLAALGPYALAAAAVLAIASALLPGEKPSGRGQLSRINLNSENQTFEGLGGNRFSQDNRDAAANAVGGIAQLARDIGNKLGGARIGGDVAVGVTSGRGGGPGQLYLQIGANTQQFANDEAGSKQLAETAARLILEEFRRQGTATGDYAGILAASPTVEVLSQNLEWYEKTYKVLTQAAEPVSAFQQSIDQLTAQFQPAIDKARELSLSVEAMTQAREREIAKLVEQRAIQLNSFAVNLDVRRLRAQGAGQAADFLAFDLNAETERRTARESLEAAGLTAEMVAERMLWLENTLADERLAIQRQYGEAAVAEAQRVADAQLSSARTILDYLNGQALGATSSLSPTARLAEAERQFNAALQGGDARALTSAADALLSNSQAVFGGASQAFAQREASVRQVLVNRGASATGEGATVAALSQMTAALSAELASLRSGFDALLAETRRRNDQMMLVAA